MKRGRTLLISAGLLVAFILAFFLQDVIRQAVVTPLAYLWWVLKLVYSVIPQVVLWILLLAVLILIVITSLLKCISIGQKICGTFQTGPGSCGNPGRMDFE